MKKITVKIRWQTLLILSFFSYDLIYAVLSAVIRNTGLSSIICNCFLLAVILAAICKAKKVVKPDAIAVVLISALIFAITVMFHSEYYNVMIEDSNWNIFKMVFILHGGVFSYFYFRVENKPEDLLKDLKIAVWPVWLCYTLKTIRGVSFESVSAVSGNTVLRTYNQAYGYEFLFVAIIFTFIFLKEKKKIYGLLTFMALIQIMLYASRTAILSYGLYIVLYLLAEDMTPKKIYKKIFYSCLLIAGLLLITSNTMISTLNSLCNSMGISSKIIDAFLSGSNELDGGRERLWASGIEMIKNNFWGLGAYCDNYQFGVYVHNIVIQMLMTFGWIIGGGIIVCLARMILKMIIAPKCLWKSLFLMFLSMTAIRLSLSYSFWYDQNFWFTIAIYVSYITSQKKEAKKWNTR